MPLVSIFTPTNAPGPYLDELYASLRCQNHDDFEWLLLLNGAARAADVGTRAWSADSRVRVVADESGTDKVGALKRRAASLCRGAVLVECDHDDLLAPLTLPRVAAAVAGGAGFVYSDVACFDDATGDPRTFDPAFGWRTYPLDVYGRRFTATAMFPVTARSLCEVYYAPDHVRCWTRAAYVAAGGHDEKLSVGDDHDLVCRTYLAGVPFAHAGRCGYLYRYHAGNTHAARSDAVVAQSAANRRRHLPGLVAEWCRREKLAALDLGAAYKAGTWSPDDPAALPDGGRPVGHVLAGDVLQFCRPEAVVPFFNAAHRLLAPGGHLTVLVPSAAGRYADQNPLHRTRFNPNTFLYFADRRFAQNLPGVDCRFELLDCREFYSDADFRKYDMKVIQADLVALKGRRSPGKHRI